MSRVEDLEARVDELQAELDGLLDEYMAVRRRLHDLEDGPESPPEGVSGRSDPHAAIIESGPSTGAEEGTDPVTVPDEEIAAAGGEASQEEVDEAVRRVEGGAGGPEPEPEPDDIIVG